MKMDCMQAEYRRLQNEPLTLEELKKMVGEPVWCDDSWWIIQDIKDGIIDSYDSWGEIIDGFAIITSCNCCIIIKDNIFYKQKPREVEENE